MCRVEKALTSPEYGTEMSCGYYKYCFATITTSFLLLGFTGAAEAESGFHAQSRNLPATSTSNDRDCSELLRAGKTSDAGSVPDRTVTPADIEPMGSENFPIVRFDLGLGKRRKNRLISPGPKNSQMRARDLTVGEVSVDTFNGEVALDGRALTQPKTRYDC